MKQPMTKEQHKALQEYLTISEELSHCYIEQIHFLAGGNISQSELTIVVVQKDEDPGGTGKWYRYIDQISQDGRTTEYKTVELRGNPFEAEAEAEVTA